MFNFTGSSCLMRISLLFFFIPPSVERLWFYNNDDVDDAVISPLLKYAKNSSNTLLSAHNGLKYILKVHLYSHSQIWPPLGTNFLALRVWEVFGMTNIQNNDDVDDAVISLLLKYAKNSSNTLLSEHNEVKHFQKHKFF